MAEENSALHKEFELERLILFSDAVFAIAITIIIIELKFPEIPKNATSLQIFKAFLPTLIQFAAFILSFFFIGVSWMRHLELFRYLTKYDTGLVKRNLLFLFFIVSFPFSASGITEHIRPGFMLPLLIYFVNIAAITICHYIITNYIFRVKPRLCINGHEAKKKYMFLESKWIAVALASTAVFYVFIVAFVPPNSVLMALPTYSLIVLVVVIRRRLKKYKPVSTNEG